MLHLGATGEEALLRILEEVGYRDEDLNKDVKEDFRKGSWRT